jgi:aldehyde dehydrogenase (NAD+)
MLTDHRSKQGVLLAQLALEAGFPPGIVSVVSGAGETGALLSSHMQIRCVSLVPGVVGVPGSSLMTDKQCP